MSMRFNNTRMNYPNQDFPTGQRASISFFTKINRTGSDTVFSRTFFNNYYFILYNTYLRCAYVYEGLLDVFYDAPIASGIVTHVAMTFDNGTYKCYINGSLKSNQSYPAYPNLKQHNEGMFIGPSVADMEFDDIGIWQDYVLTQDDVYAIRSRVSGIEKIGRSKLGYYITADGPIGSAVSIASSGAKSRGNIADAPASITSNNNIVFTDPLIYSPTVYLNEVKIGPSAKTLYVSLKDANNVPTNVFSIQSNPTLTVNGSTNIALTGAIWGSYLPYIIYPITGNTINKNDSVVFNAQSDWVASTNGYIGSATNVPVDTSYISGTFLPAVVTGNRTMSMGYNLDMQVYYGNVCYSSNLMNQAAQSWAVYQGGGSVWQDNNRNLTGITNGTTAHRQIARCDVPNGYDNKGYPSIMTGIYNLEWSGNGDCALQDWGQNYNFVNMISSGVLSGNTSIKYKKYLVTVNPALSYHVDLDITSTRASVYNPTIYHEDNRGSRWDKRVVSQVSGFKIFRSLNWLNINSSNIIDQYDNTNTVKSYDILKYKNVGITNVSGYSNISGYFNPGNNIYMEFETISPHEMEDGTTCNLAIPKVNLRPAGSINSLFLTTQVKKVSSTRFAVSYYYGAAGYSVSGFQLTSGASMEYYTWKTAGYDEFIDFCNDMGAEPWVLIPHMATDNLVQRIASGVRDRLPVGRKVHVEYTNEHWNYGLAFQQAFYCYGKGRENVGGVLSQSQYYTKRANQIHNIFKNIFQENNRSSDVCRTFASQATFPDVTSQIVNYAYSNSIPIDELAIAPYWGVTPDGSNLAREYDLFDYNMLLDVAEMSVQYDAVHLDNGSQGSYSYYVKNHLNILSGKFPSAKLISYEGGLEIGINQFSSLSQTASDTRNRNFSVHPRIKGIMNCFFQKNQEAGIQDFVYFHHAGPYYNNRYLWAVYTSPYQQIGNGDGSDGLFDNRTNLNNLLKVVSPVGKAMADWKYYYDAWNYIPSIPDDGGSNNNFNSMLISGFYVVFQPSKGNSSSERQGNFIVGTPDEELFGTYFVQGSRYPLNRKDNY